MRRKLSLKNRIYQHSITKSMRFYLENLIIYMVRMLKRQKIISEVRYLVDFVVLHIQGTGIPRLPRFLVTRFHFARTFEAIILYYKMKIFLTIFFLAIL